MKITFISLLFCSILNSALCQVTGKLVTEEGRAVAFANVALLKSGDTSVVKSTLTDEKGIYVFNNAASGSYMLRVNSIGYRVFNSAVFELTAAREKDFGAIVMKEEASQLQGIIVRAEKPLYQQQAEGLVVNVENSVLTKGSSVLEVLERSPGVIIDHHNNSIALNGKTGVTVMIDGKLTHMSMQQLITLLNGMSADEIATIELLTTPSAKYDAEGSAGIINIVLKKTKKKGTNGTVNITGGYGKSEKAGADVNVSHNAGKVGLNGAYSFSHNRSYNVLDAYGDEVVSALGGAAHFDYLGVNRPAENDHNVRAGVDVKLTPKTSVGGSISYNSSVATANSLNNVTYNMPPDSLLTFNGSIKGVSHWKNIISSLYAEKQVSEGEKIDINLDYLTYNINNPGSVQGNFVDKHGNDAGTNGDSLFSPGQRAYGSTAIKVAVAKIDYTRQLGKKVKLETGAKVTYTKNASVSGIESLINGNWVSPVETVNNIAMSEGIGGLYASVKTQVSPSVNLVTGLRYEYYNTHAADGKTGQSTLSRKLGQLFPSMFLSKKLNDNSTLQLSYTKRISRPAYNDLASYIAYNDPLSVFTGNPLLKPTITHNIKLGYNYHNYAFSLLFSRDDNLIAQGQITASPSGTIVYISPQNVTYQNNITLQASLPFKVGDWWNMNYGFTGGWRQFKVDYTMQPVTKSYFGYSFNFSESVKLPKSFSAELSGNYNSLYYYATSRILGSGSVSLGIKKELKNNKGTFQLSVSDLLNTMKFRNYIGEFTQDAFYTKAFVLWSAESAAFPIIRLTYTRAFGTGAINNQRKDESSKDERDRVR